MVVPHWSGHNSKIVSWWCLIGQDVIPRWLRGGASWLGCNSVTPISRSLWWCLMIKT